jgi:hypothetical protein
LTAKTCPGDIHEMAVSTYLGVHGGSHSDMKARQPNKCLKMGGLAAMRVAAVELAHISCFLGSAIESWFFFKAVGDEGEGVAEYRFCYSVELAGS